MEPEEVKLKSIRIRFQPGDIAYHIRNDRIFCSQVDLVEVEPLEGKVTCTLLSKTFRLENKGEEYEKMIYKAGPIEVSQDELHKTYFLARTALRETIANRENVIEKITNRKDGIT